MANNVISRTGTYTSSGTAGGAGTYDYSSTSGYAGIDYYSNDDLENGSIFVDIDSEISIKFSEEVDNSSVSVFTKDTELPFDSQNKKGTVGLTHVVSSVTGEGANNLRALKLTSLPIAITGEEHSAVANQEFVEMTSFPSTTDNQTYRFVPKTNLSSNTTYFLRMDPANVLDATGAGISYTIEKGFVTDNTQSFITTGNYYDGFSMQIERVDLDTSTETDPNSDGETGPQPDSLTLYRTDGTVSSATTLKIQSIEGTVLTYQLDPASYKMNVSYTATDPIVITNINHGLADDDKIEVYDIVSGEVVKTGAYTITEITSDTFSIPIDGTGSDAGRLNYYRNANKNDLFKWNETESEVTYVVRKKVLSVPKKNEISIDELSDVRFETKATSAGSTDEPKLGRKGKLIRLNEAGDIISYVAVDSSEHGGKSIASDFVNNSIVDITTTTPDVRFHIKANTSPDYNVHPFHSSAPKVTSTFPGDGESFPRRLTITEITRKGAIAIVSTNHPHNLIQDDLIKIVDSTQDIYNVEKKVLYVPTSNTFQYDLGASSDFSNVQSPAPGEPILQIGTGDPVTYAEKYNAIFVNFSQSMNTSTITVANSTHLISANGLTSDFETQGDFAYGQDSASSTIQLSDSGFEDIESCVSVIASSGNSVFAIVPEILRRNHAYNIKVKTDVQDLGQTNSLYEFTTLEGFATGLRVIDPQTGEEIIYSKDEKPPKIKKISVGTTVFESVTLSEITSPDTYQAETINLGSNPIKIQFSESMKIDSVTSATINTLPTGTVQLSPDNFVTVVQMLSTDPVVTTTDEDNDTFSFTPVANLSASTVYTLKVLRGVSDASPEENQMEKDNVSSIKVLTVNAAPAASINYYSPGEIISGVRTLTIKANTGEPAIGLIAGDTFLGLTSKGKGKVLDFTEADSLITSIRYTELAGQDGSIKPLIPGEVCKIDDDTNFTIDNVAITEPAEGNVVSFVSSTRKLIYRDNRVDNEFVSANSSAERIVGRTSDGYAFASSSGTEGIVGEGFKTDTTAIIANVFFANTDGDLLSPVDGNLDFIDEKSNLTVTFNQTMNVESINFNAVDSIVRDPYNILLSYDPLFGNTIPLSTDFTSSNNDTVFEFQPAILSNTSLQLTQNKNLYAKITQTAKNKGGMNLVSEFSPSNYANTVQYSPNTFTSTTASVFTPDGQEIELGLGTSLSMPNQTSAISKTTSIIIHFNEVPQFPPVAVLNEHIELSTYSNFSSGVVVGSNPSEKIIGIYGTQVHIQLGVALTASTQYYLRFLAWPSHTYKVLNEGGVGIYPPAIYFNSFTTTA